MLLGGRPQTNSWGAMKRNCIIKMFNVYCWISFFVLVQGLGGGGGGGGGVDLGVSYFNLCSQYSDRRGRPAGVFNYWGLFHS